ncbi:hypothetical protein CLV67_1111, partial [Actinoplanes italicus]
DTAARITIPVEYLLQWDDEGNPRDSVMKLFDEGIIAQIRLIQRRGYGYRNLDALTAAIYLCLGGVTLNPPMEI